MNEIIRHRGPDDQGQYSTKQFSMGTVRLSILDLSSLGHQPMTYSKDGKEVCITYNGEIYNFHDLKTELEALGYLFKSNSDTEVILASYLEWGPECVNKFCGMWAFALYDREKNFLFLSRDRFGIKPLYYYCGGEKLIFSSEIKAILQHEIERKPNEKLIFDYLFYGLVDHTEDTFFQQIKRLLPGHSAIFYLENREFRVWRYYTLKVKQQAKLMSSDASVQDFTNLFYQSVGQHMLSDVVVGSCLSGGLDSSSIVCAMRQNKPNGEIQAFSLGFPGTTIDETPFQKEVASACGAKLSSTTFSPDDLLRDFEDLVWSQEEPFLSLSIYGQYKVAKLVNENHVKVVLDGQGGDETLGGYQYQFGYYYYELFRRGQLIRLIKEILAYRKKHHSLSALNYFAGLLLPQTLKNFFLARNKYHLTKDFVKKYSMENDRRFQRKSLNDSLLEATTYSPLPSLLRYEDKNSMRWSVESRVPFLDHTLVEFSISTRSDCKINYGSTKILLRKALDGKLPANILKRQDKIGFEVPERANSEAIQQFIRKIVESSQFKNRSYFDSEKVSRLLSETFSTGKRPKIFAGEDIWRIVILELWFRIYIDPPSIIEEAIPVRSIQSST